MRILFLVHTLGRTRHFRNVLSDLLDRGHTVVLAPAHQPDPQKPASGFYSHPRIEVVGCPAAREDRWAAIIDPLRRARDYLRFFDQRYANAWKLSARAAEHAPAGWNRAIARHPWMKRRWRVLQHALA